MCSAENERGRNEVELLRDPLVDEIMKDRKLMSFQKGMEKGRGKENKLKLKRNLFFIG